MSPSLISLDMAKTQNELNFLHLKCQFKPVLFIRVFLAKVLSYFLIRMIHLFHVCSFIYFVPQVYARQIVVMMIVRTLNLILTKVFNARTHTQWKPISSPFNLSNVQSRFYIEMFMKSLLCIIKSEAVRPLESLK